MEEAQLKMIQTQLELRGIADQAVLKAMAMVPRHLFVPVEMRPYAYEDRALPLTEGQTISQPFIVALMAQTLTLHGTERVLEIGTGSGYAAAVLSLLAAEVYSIERSRLLADTARLRLQDLGYAKVQVFWGDGTNGLPKYKPYDAISVAAASPWVPQALREQLAENGRLIIPVGGIGEQLLLLMTKREGGFSTEKFGGVRFVPLVGEHAWKN